MRTHSSTHSVQRDTQELTKTGASFDNTRTRKKKEKKENVEKAEKPSIRTRTANHITCVNIGTCVHKWMA